MPTTKLSRSAPHQRENIQKKLFSKLNFLALLFLSAHISNCDELQSNTFFKNVICDLSDRISAGCSKPPFAVRSFIQCALECDKDRLCIGASLNLDKFCFLHQECPSLTYCKTAELSHVYMSKKCQFGESWSPSKETCDCFDGWPEDRCYPTVRECRDLFSLGYGTGYHRVTFHIDNEDLNSFPAICFISRSYNLARLYVMYSDGTQFNNRTWVDYVGGFYRGGRNTWLGLEHWHDVIKSGYSRVVITINYQVNGRQLMFRWTLDGFRMENAASGYAFDYESVTAVGGSNEYQVGDCVGPNRNVPFSTWDNDNDGTVSENCASKIGSGWWYNGCTNICNIMGLNSKYWSGSTVEELVAMPGINPLEIAASFVTTQVHTERL